MNPPPAIERLHEALREIDALMQARYHTSQPNSPNSDLDQFGLKDGAEIVEEYLAVGEAVLAYEHLSYMIQEATLTVSPQTARLLSEAAGLLGAHERSTTNPATP